MRKTIFQGLAVVLLFFATWLVLSQVNWVTVLRIKQITQTTEEKLGELLWDFFRKSDQVIEDAEVMSGSPWSRLSDHCALTAIFQSP